MFDLPTFPGTPNDICDRSAIDIDTQLLQFTFYSSVAPEETAVLHLYNQIPDFGRYRRPAWIIFLVKCPEMLTELPLPFQKSFGPKDVEVWTNILKPVQDTEDDSVGLLGLSVTPAPAEDLKLLFKQRDTYEQILLRRES